MGNGLLRCTNKSVAMNGASGKVRFESPDGSRGIVQVLPTKRWPQLLNPPTAVGDCSSPTYKTLAAAPESPTAVEELFKSNLQNARRRS